MVVTFFHGRPACGKDTQANLIVGSLPNSNKVSGVYRSAYTQKGPYAKYHDLVQPYMLPLGEGLNIPGVQVSKILSGILEDEKAKGTGTLFVCGLLRTKEHLQFTDELLKAERELTSNHVYIETSPERALKQTVDRFERDSQNGEARLDDSLVLMQRRLNRFELKVIPMLAQLASEGRLLRVDGEQSILDVNTEIIRSLYPQPSRLESVGTIRIDKERY